MLKFCSLSLVGARGWTPRPAKPAPLVPFKASASFNKPCQSAGTQPAALHQSSSVSVQSAKLCVLHRTCVDCSLLPLYLSTLACVPASASATESITYTPGAGADVVKNVAGLAYVALLAFWLFKVVGRRVKRSTTEVRQSPPTTLLLSYAWVYGQNMATCFLLDTASAHDNFNH